MHCLHVIVWIAQQVKLTMYQFACAFRSHPVAHSSTVNRGGHIICTERCACGAFECTRARSIRCASNNGPRLIVDNTTRKAVNG